MFRIAVIFTGITVARMADIEHRSPWIWGIAAVAATIGLSELLGRWFWFAPPVTLIAAFAALWFLKSRDDARRGRGKIVR